MTEQTNYKDTLNLPQTLFAMKANLVQREPETLARWASEGLYGEIRKASSARPKSILHDGPPYANGHIHIGHALNKILKDVIVKFRTMQGYDALYIPGWDCHGLPIEHQCLKDMGKRKDQVERVEFRRQARKYAEKYVAIQKEEFKRLGIFGEWENPYLTMTSGYQAVIADTFLKLFAKGFIEQRLKPVPWCFDCETALADAELEYEDKTSQTVTVKFPVLFESLKTKMHLPAALGTKPVYLLVWTTTPWTLPANVGVAVHPDLQYTVLELPGESWLLAEDLVAHLQSLNVMNEAPVSSSSCKGRELEGLLYRHPFLDREGRTILADYVSATDGTGIVHIAPGHGEEDYRFGHLDYRLDILSPVDEKGRFTKEFSPCEGIHVFKANVQITEMLREKKLLLAEEPHAHSYPHCWRCKKPIIFRATKQWFMKIDHENLRERMAGVIRDKIRFTPDWGKNRIGAMVESRPDWCLSRQRYWGVPIPVLSCRKCGLPFGRPSPVDAAVLEEVRAKVTGIFARENADAWFSLPASAFLPADFACRCGSREFEKADDIIDVWFDSGASHQAVLKGPFGLTYPAALYLEGSDQHRGWFQSSLTTAMALEGRPPFEGVLTHGFVVDGEGRKMSKSAGNVVSPQEVMKEFGADILRLWVSSCDYQFDVRLSKEILNQMADSYRKIRNTFRYVLGNLYDFDPAADALAPVGELEPWDQWAVEATNEVVRAITAKYDAFAFHEIYQLAHHFCAVQLSAYYFDILKDILYTSGKNSRIRRSAQTALFYILSRLVKVLAPILPFTMDEVWKAYPVEPGVASVHASLWERESWVVDPGLYREWCDLRALRDALTTFLEKQREAKVIGSSLDARIFLHTEHAGARRILENHMGSLGRIFIASYDQVAWMEEVRRGSEETEVAFESLSEKVKIFVSVEKAEGEKCVRCWSYSRTVGSGTAHPALCGKCVEAVSPLDS
ncbi:MAG: isoleucine--tRNA ligase [Candidatus Omnitrophota bacterium]|jgi:isoleucyl-tRNA synthetase